MPSLRDAAFVTTSSEPIASAYSERLRHRPSVIAQYLSASGRRRRMPRDRISARLRLYWFSQTIGPGRGLEDAILALGRAGIAADLALRGRPRAGYIAELMRALAAAHAPRVEVVHLPPAPPDAMVDCARGYDVGLALEQMTPLNRQLCLTNKAFTYILAGMAVAMTDTPGQHALGLDLGRAAALVPAGDIDALAAAFARWTDDRRGARVRKAQAWNAATRRWHWEHELERGTLLSLVREALA